MSPVIQVLLVVLVVVVLVAGAYAAYKAEQKRAAAIAALASAQGWTYRRDADDKENRYVGEPFGRGQRRRGRHLLEGHHRGHQVNAFEYLFTTTEGSGKNRRTRTHRFMVCGMSLPTGVPTLQVGREHAGTRLLGAVGLRDLQLESEEFNAAFRISADDDRFAYAVLNPPTMAWMLAEPRLASLPFRFERADLVTWTSGRMDPAQVVPALDLLVDLRERVPGFAFDPR